MTLTSYERVRRAFERLPIDRIPKHDSFWPDTITRWASEGLKDGEEGALRELDSDMRNISWVWPQPFPGRQETISEDEETRVVRDANGALLRFWKNRSGTPEHLGWECDSRHKWFDDFRPRLLTLLDRSPIDTDRIRGCEASVRVKGKWGYLAGVECFEMMRAILGDEGFLYAMAEDPEWVADIAEVSVTTSLACYQAILDAGVSPDGLWIYGDMAFNHATVCSPAMYRELIWPHHRRIAEWAHERGLKVIYHTDGDINRVLDLYADAGFDCIQPLEAKANMDVRKIAPICGERLLFMGNINVMVIESGDLELIESEIATKFAAGQASRCYIYHSDHSIPPSVSWDLYKAVIGIINRHAAY